jgi:hypothetical protein
MITIYFVAKTRRILLYMISEGDLSTTLETCFLILF